MQRHLPAPERHRSNVVVRGFGDVGHVQLGDVAAVAAQEGIGVAGVTQVLLLKNVVRRLRQGGEGWAVDGWAWGGWWVGGKRMVSNAWGRVGGGQRECVGLCRKGMKHGDCWRHQALLSFEHRGGGVEEGECREAVAWRCLQGLLSTKRRASPNVPA